MISCVVNFKENLMQSQPYYRLLISRLSGENAEPHILEHSAMVADCEPFSKICEGYQFTALFCGELWNTDELKKHLTRLGYCFLTDSDIELALNTYIHYGKRCAEMLCGSYSMVVCDPMRRRVFAAVDDNASYPLFFAQAGDETIICSSVCGILRHPEIEPKIERDAVCDLLSFPANPSGNLFKGIYAIPPSHFLRITADCVGVSEYSAANKAKLSDKCEVPAGSDCAVVSTSGKNSLCRLLADTEKKKYRRLTAISFENPGDAEKECSCKCIKINLCEREVSESLRTYISHCGIPVLSEDEFLLPSVFSQSRANTIFLNRPENKIISYNYYDFAVKNRLYHPAVMKTLDWHEGEMGGFFARGAADYYGVDLKLRYISAEERIEVDYGELERLLRRNLLGVIAHRAAPLNAFFDRSVILRLCEGRLNTYGISSVALMAYLLQLNLLFSELNPRLI